jgi:hypothetical protein
VLSGVYSIYLLLERKMYFVDYLVFKAIFQHCASVPGLCAGKVHAKLLADPWFRSRIHFLTTLTTHTPSNLALERTRHPRNSCDRDTLINPAISKTLNFLTSLHY